MALLRQVPKEEPLKSLVTWQVFLDAVASFICEQSYDLPNLIADQEGHLIESDRSILHLVLKAFFCQGQPETVRKILVKVHRDIFNLQRDIANMGVSGDADSSVSLMEERAASFALEPLSIVSLGSEAQ